MRQTAYQDTVKISIHAPREGSDSRAHYHLLLYGVFLSTLPARGATFQERDGPFVLVISIHAPREGSDL